MGCYAQSGPSRSKNSVIFPQAHPGAIDVRQKVSLPAGRKFLLKALLEIFDAEAAAGKVLGEAP